MLLLILRGRQLIKKIYFVTKDERFGERKRFGEVHVVASIPGLLREDILGGHMNTR